MKTFCLLPYRIGDKMGEDEHPTGFDVEVTRMPCCHCHKVGGVVIDSFMNSVIVWDLARVMVGISCTACGSDNGLRWVTQSFEEVPFGPAG